MRRRNFLALTGAIGAAAALPSRLLLAQQSGQVTIATLGGTLEENQRKAYFEPFQQATGIEANIVSYSSLSQALVQARTGNIEWDVIYMSGGGMLSLENEGALEEIDYSVFDSAQKQAIQPQSLLYKYGAPDAAFTRALSYSTKVFGNEAPRSWADVWNVEKFPGPRTLGGFSGTLSPDLEFALLADGVSMEQLYPLDVDRAFSSLDKIREHVTTFWTTGAMAPQMLTDGEVVIASAYVNRISDLQRAGVPVTWEWNQGMMYMGYWGILKGAKNYENAMKYIAYATRGESQAQFVMLNPMGPANSKAFEHIPEDKQTALPTAPANLTKQFVYNDQWWSQHRNEIQERWDEWLLG